MLGVLLIALLQAGAEPAPASQTTEQASVAEPGTMSCQPWDRGTRTRICTTAEGETLRCRRETRLGSRFPETVCLTYREDQQVEGDSRAYVDRQQRLWDNQSQ